MNNQEHTPSNPIVKQTETIGSPQSPVDGISATYSVEDNKLRLYALHRLDAEIYARVKAAGFKWAPKQDLFVAPKWTPQREDLCLALAGEIQAEQSTLAERAEQKAERLDTIADNKARAANAYFRAADDYAKAFENGQPILIGHHSERKARKTQARMHAAMQKGTENHRAIAYWNYRAEGVERHANRTNNPAVRARRIKTLLADLRDLQRGLNHGALCLAMWQKATTNAQIEALAGRLIESGPLTSHKDYEAFREGQMTAQDLRTFSIWRAQNLANSEGRKRWIDHVLGRLGYEREMLGPVARYEGDITPTILQAFAREHGAHKPKATKLPDGRFQLTSSVTLPLHIGGTTSLDHTQTEWRTLMQAAGYAVPDPKPAKPPILNFKAETLTAPNRWRQGETETYEQVTMTKAEYAKIYSEQRGTRLSSCGTFRFKVCPNPFHEGPRYQAPWVAVFLIDSKCHNVPDSVNREEPAI